MTSVIVIGHAGYATAVKRSLAMLMGEVDGFYYVDFNEKDSTDILHDNIQDALTLAQGDDILFLCDLSGGTPFRVAAELCALHPGWAVAAGMNVSAYTEVSFCLELSPKELAKLACHVTRETVLMYPQE